MSDRRGNKNSNNVGVYLRGQATETGILWGISDSTASTKNNILEVYLIGQRTEKVIICG